MNPCIFLDRDGVINKDYVDYVYDLQKFEFLPGVEEGLINLKNAGYKLIIITNQSGIIKGIYDHEDVYVCLNHINDNTDNAIDDMFYSPYHENWTNSLSRKPKTFLFERAIAKHEIDVANSFMMGDKQRDLIPARKLGMKTILIGDADSPTDSDLHFNSLFDASKHIIDK